MRPFDASTFQGRRKEELLSAQESHELIQSGCLSDIASAKDLEDVHVEAIDGVADAHLTVGDGFVANDAEVLISPKLRRSIRIAEKQRRLRCHYR